MKILGNILASIVSIFYFFILFIMMLLLFVSNVFSADYYENILDDVDLMEMKLADFGIESGDVEFDEDASVEDLLVQTLEEAGVAEEDTRRIVNNEKINEVIGEFISDTMVYLTTKEEVPQLDYQDVMKIMNGDEVSSVLDTTPNDEELKQFVEEINKYIADEFEGGFNYVE